MSTALAITQKFEQFITLHGEDPYITNTLSKMISVRLQTLKKELKSVQTHTAHFERIYGKNSAEFYQEFTTGTAGDSMDFIEWASLVKMRDRLLAEQAALTS